MPAISEVLLNSQTHPLLDISPVTVTGEAFKGDGYYGWGDGVHTVEVEITVFAGTISIQASLATAPTDSDWFTVPLAVADSEAYRVDTTGLITKISSIQTIQYASATTAVNVYNFTGNFVWVRAVVTNWTAGTINRVLFNH
jgi:hypothetical protein